MNYIILVWKNEQMLELELDKLFSSHYWVSMRQVNWSSTPYVSLLQDLTRQRWMEGRACETESAPSGGALILHLNQPWNIIPRLRWAQGWSMNWNPSTPTTQIYSYAGWVIVHLHQFYFWMYSQRCVWAKRQRRHKKTWNRFQQIANKVEIF